MGTWVGQAVSLTLNPNGTYFYRDPNTQLTGRRWSWANTTQVAGVLTLEYQTPTATQIFTNKIYFGITWVDENQIRLTDAGGNSDTLRRQSSKP